MPMASPANAALPGFAVDQQHHKHGQEWYVAGWRSRAIALSLARVRSGLWASLLASIGQAQSTQRSWPAATR